jgi:adenosylhomocysteine nucleosidase
MRVGLLVPMQQELAPLRRKLALRRVRKGERSMHVGMAGGNEVVATLTGIGTVPARAAAEWLLREAKPDHVMVVGIAGGVDPAQPIGALIAPERVVDASGREFSPAQLGELPPRGVLFTSDALITGAAEAAALAERGVVGLDMETAAVAAVCEARGCPWSVFRAISDRVADGTTDPAVLALAGPDGSGDLGAVARYLLARPWRVVRLARLARGTFLAANAAADAAIRACERLGQQPHQVIDAPPATWFSS